MDLFAEDPDGFLLAARRRRRHEGGEGAGGQEAEHLQIEPFLATEVVADQGKGPARALGDHADARPIVAVLGKALQGHFDQVVPGVWGVRAHGYPQDTACSRPVPLWLWRERLLHTLA